jgi:tRNA-binding EMAP/Myf-like protein
VGKIVEVTHHPDADSLFIEKIDIGEAEPRQIISGLRKFYSLEEMMGRLLVVVANLKPSKLKGTLSAGMVLCAATADHSKVELVNPPAGSVPGDVINAKGIAANPDAKVDPKKKNHAWRKSISLMRTNDDKVACFDGIPLIVEGKGECTVPSLNSQALG